MHDFVTGDVIKVDDLWFSYVIHSSMITTNVSQNRFWCHDCLGSKNHENDRIALSSDRMVVMQALSDQLFVYAINLRKFGWILTNDVTRDKNW